MSAEPFPAWLRPPVGGWTAEDLDRLPELPPHTELIDGSLIFASPQTTFHNWAMWLLEYGLRTSVPTEWEVWREMSVVLGKRNRPEPDLLAARRGAYGGPKQTAFQPEDVLLAIEVVSEESVERDRDVKPRKYAEAGIRYFWRVESDEGRPVAYTYEIDPAAGAYIGTGVHREVLKLDHPFPVEIELTRR